MERKLLLWCTQNSAAHTTRISKFDIISQRGSIFEFVPQQGVKVQNRSETRDRPAYQRPEGAHCF